MNYWLTWKAQKRIDFMKSILLVLLLILSNVIYGQKGNQNECRWHRDDKITPSDYKAVRKSGLLYYLSNDNDNIYLDIIISDAGEQNMILRDGFVIWINMDGKSMKKMGVRFPVGAHNQSGINRSMQPDKNIIQENIQGNPLAMANTIELIGFTNETERRFASDNPDSFRGYIKPDNRGTLYYRLVMPMSKLPVRSSREGNGIVPFTLGVEYGFSGESTTANGTTKTETSSSYKSGSYSSGSAKGKKPGKGSHMAKGSNSASGAIGKNSKNQQPVQGSVLFWIKDVRLASSK
jgi:hypothetical protein